MARLREAAPCWPADYDARHLRIIPDEEIERGYGRGDPSSYVREGDGETRESCDTGGRC